MKVHAYKHQTRNALRPSSRITFSRMPPSRTRGVVRQSARCRITRLAMRPVFALTTRRRGHRTWRKRQPQGELAKRSALRTQSDLQGSPRRQSQCHEESQGSAMNDSPDGKEHPAVECLRQVCDIFYKGMMEGDDEAAKTARNAAHRRQESSRSSPSSQLAPVKRKTVCPTILQAVTGSRSIRMAGFCLGRLFGRRGFQFVRLFLTDVASRVAPNRQEELLDVRIWLTDIHGTGMASVLHGERFGSFGSRGNMGGRARFTKSADLHLVAALRQFARAETKVSYHNDGSGWRPVSPPLGDTIFSIRGTSEKDIYVCGAGALFWRFDRRAWTRIELPTNERLLGILSLSPTDLVCGRGGVLFGARVTHGKTHHSPGTTSTASHFIAASASCRAGEGILPGWFASAEHQGQHHSPQARLAMDLPASSGDNLAARFDGTGLV